MNQKLKTVGTLTKYWNEFFKGLSFITKLQTIFYIFIEITRRIFFVLLPSILIFFAVNINSNFKKYSIGFILVILAMSIFTYFTGILRSKTQNNSFLYRYNLIPKISEKILKMNFNILESQSGQLKIDRAYEAVYNGSFAGVEFVLNTIISFFITFIEVSLFIAFSFFVDYRTTIFVIIIDILILIIKNKNKKWLSANKKNRDYIVQKQNYLARQLQKIENANEMSFYPIRKWFTKCFENYSNKICEWEKTYERKKFLIDLLNNFLIFCCNFFILFSSYKMFVNQTTEITEIVSFANILFSLGGLLTGFVTLCSELNLNVIHLNELDEYFKIEDSLKHDVDVCVNKIEFKNVSFVSEESNKRILDKINFKVNKGDKIAIVGENGAGKSTLINLICGLYKPSEGEIFINNVNSKEYSEVDRYNMLSAVLQDGVIYSFTVAENISCKTLEETDLTKVEQCLIQAGLCNSQEEAKQFALKQIGYELGEGIQLSGGQKQKLYIARMIYDLRQCLVLDEPTAALDPISERELYELYETFSDERISFFVSHRLGSTKFCTKIICLKNGKIVETGTHDELINLHGYYYEMFKLQSEKYVK